MRQSATSVLFARSISGLGHSLHAASFRTAAWTSRFEQRPSRTAALVDTAPRAKREDERPTRLKVRITYIPTGGDPRTQSRKLKWVIEQHALLYHFRVGFPEERGGKADLESRAWTWLGNNLW